MSRFLGELLQKAQKLKSKVEEIRAGLKEMRVEAHSGDGSVRVIASCDKQLVSLVIDGGRFNDSFDAEELQSVVCKTVNDALAKADKIQKETANRELENIGLNLPGLF